MTTAQKAFFEEVLKELEYADGKHPGWPNDAVYASAILIEEAGKLTQGTIDFTYGNRPQQEAVAVMRRRAVSSAAMALRFHADLEHYVPYFQ